MLALPRPKGKKKAECSLGVTEAQESAALRALRVLRGGGHPTQTFACKSRASDRKSGMRRNVIRSLSCWLGASFDVRTSKSKT